ncbi:HYR domain-containing protein, partial [Micropruina sp.]|uniref:HYR domain-containing protein n=1 Tax=Micropruina sp. TaxID=2737536 RepID=UPI0026091B78
EVTGMSADGDVIATIPAGAAADAAMNASTASTTTDNTVTYELPDVDETPPTVTINQAGTQIDPTSTSPIVFTVVFSEPVTGFTDPATDLDLTASTAGGPLAATITPVSATEYTVEVTGMSADGDVIATIPAGAAADGAMNASTASTSTDNTVTYELPDVDETPPTVTINQAGTQVDPTSTSPIVFTVVFSEPVTGFTDPTTDLDLSASTAGGPLAATIVPVSTTEYTVEVTGMSADGDVIATIPAGAAADAATNPSTASTSTDNTVTYELPAAPLTIQVPADIVVYADPGDSGIAVDYPAPTTTGGTAPVSVACDLASGDVYPLGVTTVSCTATDAAQQTATDNFTITVLESDEPDDGDDGDGDDDLPNTGADPSAPLAAAALLLLLGGSLRLLVRRLQA